VLLSSLPTDISQHLIGRPALAVSSIQIGQPFDLPTGLGGKVDPFLLLPDGGSHITRVLVKPRPFERELTTRGIGFLLGLLQLILGPLVLSPFSEASRGRERLAPCFSRWRRNGALVLPILQRPVELRGISILRFEREAIFQQIFK